MGYLQHTYYTLSGAIDIIELGDFSYGEWMVYQDYKPKYHVNVFKDNSASDKIVRDLLESNKETIETIIAKINTQQKTPLTLNNWPFLRWHKETKKIQTEFTPLPTDWVKNLS